ncbi:hypothetical protein H5410_051540 [Solanum commersonii]|uniref:Uncharacterized protein n=1 Tax=Solanum commersonii TaxID=4109 RepID=A0A9J5WYF7_SOLCO|nr:hypothetical protein H5410_051540 [Solanum commersonii]
MAFIQMKIVADTIIHNYNIHIVEPENVYPTIIIMQVKNGLMVKGCQKGTTHSSSFGRDEPPNC